MTCKYRNLFRVAGNIFLFWQSSTIEVWSLRGLTFNVLKIAKNWTSNAGGYSIGGVHRCGKPPVIFVEMFGPPTHDGSNPKRGKIKGFSRAVFLFPTRAEMNNLLFFRISWTLFFPLAGLKYETSSDATALMGLAWMASPSVHNNLDKILEKLSSVYEILRSMIKNGLESLL